MPFPGEVILAPVTLLFFFFCFVVMCEVFLGLHNAGPYIVTWGQVLTGISPKLWGVTLGLGGVVCVLFRMDYVNEERARTGRDIPFCWGWGGRRGGGYDDNDDD